MHLCLFEDGYAGRFLPLTFFRPVYDLRCGMLSLRERITLLLAPAAVSLFVRKYLADVLQEENPLCEVNRVTARECLFVNGRVIMGAGLARQLKRTTTDCLFTSGEQLVAIRLSGENLVRALSTPYADAIDLSRIVGVPKFETEATLVGYPWDLVYANESELATDFHLLTRGDRSSARRKDVHRSAVLIAKKNIHIGRQTVVGPGVVLDATGGPIFIGQGARIYPAAVIEGPCFVGDGAVIRIGAKIYGNTAIGALCKVGGEVEHSILHSHANKQHDGYLGHSYIAPWVNLGAGTTTSNLKNTYGSIRVHIDGKPVDSAKMFVGLTAGDHVKIGINGSIDTGTVIGPLTNVYGPAVPPKYIPAFTWGTAGAFSTYDVEKGIIVAETVMSRRRVAATEAYKRMIRHIFELTVNERADYRH